MFSSFSVTNRKSFHKNYISHTFQLTCLILLCTVLISMHYACPYANWSYQSILGLLKPYPETAATGCWWAEKEEGDFQFFLLQSSDVRQFPLDNIVVDVCATAWDSNATFHYTFQEAINWLLVTSKPKREDGVMCESAVISTPQDDIHLSTFQDKRSTFTNNLCEQKHRKKDSFLASRLNVSSSQQYPQKHLKLPEVNRCVAGNLPVARFHWEKVITCLLKRLKIHPTFHCKLKHQCIRWSVLITGTIAFLGYSIDLQLASQTIMKTKYIWRVKTRH